MYFQQALSQDPKDAAYEVAIRRARFEAGQAHVEAGMKLKRPGQLEQALVEFQKAFSIDPASAIAVQEIREISEALDRAKKGQSATRRGGAHARGKTAQGKPGR